MTSEEMVTKAAADVLTAHCTYSRLREIEASADGFDDVLWTEITRLGWTASPFADDESSILPERLATLAGLLEECGRAGVALPFFQSVAAAGVLVGTEASGVRARQLTREICHGTTIAVVGTTSRMRPVPCSKRGEQISVQAVSPITIEWAHMADVLVLPLCIDNGDVILAALPLPDPRLSIVQLRALDNERLGRVTIPEGFTVSADWRLTEEGMSERRWQSLWLIVSLLRSAEMVGNCRAMLDLTVRYVLQRQVFSRVLGSFQSVQHTCALMRISLEGARLMTREAMALVARSEPFEQQAATAMYMTGRAVSDIARQAAQLHGGMGFTMEYPLNVFYRRAKAQQARNGSVDDQRRELANRLSPAGPWWGLRTVAELARLSETSDT
jgi:alkylation response protein AidB-like acyl-CoA dehydrogenase